jgi:hypothetical protein
MEVMLPFASVCYCIKKLILLSSNNIFEKKKLLLANKFEGPISNPDIFKSLPHVYDCYRSLSNIAKLPGFDCINSADFT